MISKFYLKIADYLDVTFNLSDGSYKLFHKPDRNINDIYREQNHPKPSGRIPDTGVSLKISQK